MWMFLKDLLHSGYSDNLNRAGNVVIYLFVTDLYQFLLLICIPIWVMFHFLQDKFYYFVVFQL